MRFRSIGLSLFLTLVAPGLVYAADSPPYYLALGDSLAIGLQPTLSGVDAPTNQGYADDLYALFRWRQPSLRLAKLGCSGETTTTMIHGHSCHYDLGNQLAQAVEFIGTHRVALITLDIGGDNVDHCVSLNPLAFHPDCFAAGAGAVSLELPYILTALRVAAGPRVPIIAMNYYDAFLAAARIPGGQALADASLLATVDFNSLLETIYQSFGVPVADVAAAFRISDPTPVPVLNIPLNVFLTLVWTWAGAPPPLGPDIHPNRVGYAVIAGAFVKAIQAP